MHKIVWLNLSSNKLNQKQHLNTRKASPSQKRNHSNTRQQKKTVKTRSGRMTRWRDQHYSSQTLLKYHQSKKLVKKTRDRLWSMLLNQLSLMHPLSSKLRIQIKSIMKCKKWKKTKVYHKQIKRKGNESYQPKPNLNRCRKNQMFHIIILVTL